MEKEVIIQKKMQANLMRVSKASKTAGTKKALLSGMVDSHKSLEMLKRIKRNESNLILLMLVP